MVNGTNRSIIMGNIGIVVIMAIKVSEPTHHPPPLQPGRRDHNTPETGWDGHRTVSGGKDPAKKLKEIWRKKILTIPIPCKSEQNLYLVNLSITYEDK